MSYDKLSSISFIGIRLKSWKIFLGNFQDLYVACDDLKKPDSILFEENGVKTLIANDWLSKKDDIDRKFHNFLASAKTLVDHTRLLIKYLPSDIQDQFRKKLNKTLESYLVVKFIHDLRNYFTHCKNPIDLLYMENIFYIDEGVKHCYLCIKITKKSLREYKNWDQKTSKFIDTLEDEIDVQRLSVDYFNALSELNDWINKEIPVSLSK
jgi:hypothetical protein